MQTSEYENIYKNEASHFFYVGNHNIILALTKKFFKIPRAHAKILDAGCGTGLLTKKLKSVGKVWAVDINSEAVKYAKKRSVDARLASITKLPFKKNSFDLVVSVDVLYHQKVESDERAMLEISRVLKPGGLLILKVPAYNWLRGNHDIVVHTKHRYTTGELKCLATRAGLITLKVSYFASFLLLPAILKRVIESILPTKHAKSDVSLPPYLFNSLVIIFYKLELFLLNLVNIPFGLSALVVAKKVKK